MRRVFGSGFDNLVARHDDLGTVNWYGTDRQGTVLQVFDNSGNETHAAEYDAFGTLQSGTLIDRYGFHGREHDAQTGLRHHRAREFNGQFWMSEDPIGFDANDANLYRFANNGPANAIDPSGYDYLTINKDGNAVGVRTYYILSFVKDDWRLVFGKVEEIGNSKYINYGNFFVSYDDLNAAINNGIMKEWQADPCKIIEWFRDNNISPQMQEYLRLKAIGSYDPLIQDRINYKMEDFPTLVNENNTVDQGMSDAIRLVEELAKSLAIDALLTVGPSLLGPFFKYVAAKGWKVIKDKAGKAIGIVDQNGNPVKPGAIRQAINEVERVENCFPAGTLVATEFGPQPIQDIQPGDRVWAYDRCPQEWRLCRVLRSFRREYDGEMVAVTAAGETISSTSQHPWWVCQGDNLTDRPSVVEIDQPANDGECVGRWVSAIDLKVGDMLMLRSGERVAITELVVYHDYLIVYNFHVEDLRCYSVGSMQFLVHNESVLREALRKAQRDPRPGEQGAHIVPKGNWDKTTRSDKVKSAIKESQKKVHEFVPEGGIDSAYNGFWSNCSRHNGTHTDEYFLEMWELLKTQSQRTKSSRHLLHYVTMH